MKKVVISLFMLFVPISELEAQKVDLTDAGIIISVKIESPMRETLVKILREEIARRTSIEWQQVKSWKKEKNAIIAIALTSDKELFGKSVPQRRNIDLPEYRPEGVKGGVKV